MKNNFKFTYYILILLFTQFVIVSCSDNDDGYSDVDGLPPTVEITASTIKTEPGREFVITGKITDKDGLASIQLVNKDLYLDKVINLKKDTITYEFNLDYKFVSEKDFEESDKFDLKVIATDLGGRVTEQVITITMDGDFTAPKFTLNPLSEVTVLIKNDTKFKLNFSVEDDKALDKVAITIPELSYNKDFTTFPSSSKKFDYVEQIALPSLEATYNLTITATDKAGLETTVNSTITVSEMPDFPKMYLVDVATVKELANAVIGIPTLIERTAPYTYKARYYSAKSGSEVRFVPQKNDFEPICFGLDPDDSNKLADDPGISKPIILADKGYYEITFNVQTASYTINKYTPTDAYVPIGTPIYLDGPTSDQIPLEIGLVGSGLPNVGSFKPAEAIILSQDADNKYLFSTTLNFTAPSDVEFIIQTKHSWNWWPEPFWRWDRSEDPEANVSNAGDNGKVSVKKAGKYMFKFDSHLLRSQFYLINE